jgi:hypothetical protein
MTAISTSGDVTINGVEYLVTTTLTPVVVPTPPPTTITPSWNSAVTDLVFSDDFTTWNPDLWADSWFNGGSMNGTATNPANVSVFNSCAILDLASETSGALINTDPGQVPGGGFQFGAGYSFEAYILFPGTGTVVFNWPAVWTDGQNWPADGEIDVAEGLGTMTTNYHSSQGASNSGTIPGTWAGAFHKYGVDREAGMNYIYWDGQLVRSYATDDGGSPHYIIICVGPGNETVTGVNGEVLIDWVRVWKN